MQLRFLATAALAVIAAAAPAARAQTSISFGLRGGGNLATRSGDNPAYNFNAGNSGSTANVTTTSQQDYTRKAILAPQFGAVLNVRFGNLALQPAVLFSQKGAEQTLDATTTTTYAFGGFPGGKTTVIENLHTTSRANYLEIPLNLVYTTGGDHGFQVFAGPYAAFGMGGRVELDNQGTSTNGSGGSSGTSSYYNYGDAFFIYRGTYPGVPATASGPAFPAPYEANSGAIVARRFDAGLNAGVGYRFSALQLQLGYGLGLMNQQPGKAPKFSTEPTAYRQRVAQLTATYFFKAD